jgi:hypothetical protein
MSLQRSAIPSLTMSRADTRLMDERPAGAVGSVPGEAHRDAVGVRVA